MGRLRSGKIWGNKQEYLICIYKSDEILHWLFPANISDAHLWIDYFLEWRNAGAKNSNFISRLCCVDILQSFFANFSRKSSYSTWCPCCLNRNDTKWSEDFVILPQCLTPPPPPVPPFTLDIKGPCKCPKHDDAAKLNVLLCNVHFTKTMATLKVVFPPSKLPMRWFPE